SCPVDGGVIPPTARGASKRGPARPQPIESNDLTARQGGVAPHARPAARRCWLGTTWMHGSALNVAVSFRLQINAHDEEASSGRLLTNLPLRSRTGNNSGIRSSYRRQQELTNVVLLRIPGWRLSSLVLQTPTVKDW